MKPLQAIAHPFFDELRKKETMLPNGQPLPNELFDFTDEEKQSTTSEIIKTLVPNWYKEQKGRGQQF